MGACGGNYTQSAAVLYSPDFPDNYGTGRVCYWTIQVTGASVILFNFTFFDIVDQTDMVELLDGYTNRVVARFDGRSPPRDTVNVTGDFVILYFFSDRTNQAQGFAVRYQGRTASPRVVSADRQAFFFRVLERSWRVGGGGIEKLILTPFRVGLPALVLRMNLVMFVMFGRKVYFPGFGRSPHQLSSSETVYTISPYLILW